MTETKKRKVIKNIANLSILSGREVEMLKQADAIRNVANLLIREGFYNSYPNISLENIANVSVVPNDVKVVSKVGQLTLNNDLLNSSEDRLYLMVVGVIVVDPDITPELITEKLHTINLIGVSICKKSLEAAVSGKQTSGQNMVITYPDGEKNNVKIENGSVELTNDYFAKLDEGSSLIINGEIKFVESVDIDVVNSKLRLLVINGELVISQENKSGMTAEFVQNGGMTVIPEGFTYIGGSLKLTRRSLTKFAGKKCYSRGTVVFDDSIAPQQLEENSFQLKCRKAICSSTMFDAVDAILVDEETKIVEYKDLLMQNDQSKTFTAKELEYTEGTLTIMNNGYMHFTDDVTDDLFMKKVDVIYNNGNVECSESLYGLVELKSKNNGHIGIYGKKEEVKSDDIVLMGNMANLEL